MGFIWTNQIKTAYLPLNRGSSDQPLAAGRLEPVATALHEMMSRQLIHRKKDSID